MQISTIRAKTLIVLLMIVVSALLSSIVVISSLRQAEDDAEIVNALGRQRMLTQAMAKSVLGFTMTANSLENIKQRIGTLDSYVTQMRKTYSEVLSHPAIDAANDPSRGPGARPAVALPMPAVFAHTVSEAFQGQEGVSLDIIAEKPVNPNKGLQTSVDRRANDFLKSNQGEFFSSLSEEHGHLDLLLYSGDYATTESCTNCHGSLLDSELTGDQLLGIRKYRVRFANNISLGRDELDPSLAEYENAHEVFEQTLLAMKLGGSYPVDLSMTKTRTIEPLPTRESQRKIVEIEGALAAFSDAVKKLIDAGLGSAQYREYRQKILAESNLLRTLSDDLVIISTQIAESHNTRIFWSVIAMGIVAVATALIGGAFFSRSVTMPLRQLSTTLVDVEASGDFSKQIEVTTEDEVGHAMSALNHLLESVKSALADTNNAMQAAASGDFTARIEADFTGHLNLLKENVNRQIAALGERIGRIDSIARFHVIAQESTSVEAFSERLISEVARAVPAQHGVMYIVDEESGDFELAGSYCCAADSLSQRVAEGDGLLGQCAKENQIIVYPEIPADYVEIRSVLGGATPTSVVAIPIGYKRKVLAVIELASFTPFSDDQIGFLEELIPIIGLGFESVLRFGQAKALLYETRRKSDKLLEQQATANALGQILRSGLEPLSLEAHVDQILEQLFSVRQLSLLPKGAVFLVDDESDELVLFAEKGLSSQLLEQCARVPFRECFCGQAAAGKQPVFWSGEDRSPETRTDYEHPDGHYCLPILSGDRLLGVLNLHVAQDCGHDLQVEEFLLSVTSALASIIERKQAEEALRRVQKMDAVGQLTGGIAHDFNNILGIILGNVELLERWVPSDDAFLEQIRNIRKSTERAVALTKRLLAFSRTQAVDPVVTDLNQVIADMENLISRSVTPEIEVEHRLTDDLWPIVVDPGDFEDSLINMVLNARDAMPGGGRLALEARNCKLDAEFCANTPGAVPGDYVELAVSDTGEGIEPEIQQQIFDPFFTSKPGGINGYELAERATADRPDLKVLLASGYSDKVTTTNEQARFGANLLTKPYAFSQLARAVRTLIDDPQPPA